MTYVEQEHQTTSGKSRNERDIIVKSPTSSSDTNNNNSNQQILPSPNLLLQSQGLSI
jgi:hypothetical protein